jgi:ATP-dependent DNA helicase RecG
VRPDLLNPLFADVTSLPGVGPTLARALLRLGIARVVDLLFHLPTGWLRTERRAALAGAALGSRVAVPVTVLQHQPAGGRAPARVACLDEAGTPLVLAFFGRQANAMLARFPVGARLTVAGVLEAFDGRLQMVHPEGPLKEEAVLEVAPVYPLTAGVTRRQLEKLVNAALDRLPELPEWADPALVAARGWPAPAEAFRAAHRDPDADAARDRLAYDEILAGALAWALTRARARRRGGRALHGDGRIAGAIIAALPWPLTSAQRRVVGEIGADLGEPAAMLRLLQGDVGSGKTVVAALALARAVEAGAQGAMLAPTELLARQHLATLSGLFEGTGVRLGFLSGRERGRGRDALLAAVAAGDIDVLVGTHAILGAGVVYRDLGLAVIDEQHRFGVAQRLMLAERGARAPHMLVMTATPIPRTLALARYGEMGVSVLDERPPGRQPVDTRVVALRRVGEVIEGLARHLSAGGQAYWVCPMVDGADGGQGDRGRGDGGDAAAELRAAMLKARFGEAVALVHGRLPPARRDEAMERFARGEAKVLVATTVIEVGVDVPNATLMIIEAAERFGLAQLHQLRGRVGRGAGRSVCLLLPGDGVSETARERLRMMRETDDGFRIAEADLALRGPGELLGMRQSGEQGFRLASDEQLLRLTPPAAADSRLLLERDGGLQGPRGGAVRVLLYLFGKDAAVQTLRSG